MRHKCKADRSNLLMRFVFPSLRIRSWLVVLLAATLASSASAQGRGWLLFNPKDVDAVLVSDPVEKDHLQLGPWQIDGHFRYLPPATAGALALHRLARPATFGTDRMFSTNLDEVHSLVSARYADEGVVGFVAVKAGPPSLIPVFRYRKGDRSLWLMGEAGRKWAETAGWKTDAPAFWVDAPDGG